MEAGDWDRRYDTPELVWRDRPNVFVAAETAGLAPGRALDVACGEGRNAIWLAEQGWRATGIDFSAVALGKARRLAQLRGVAGRVEWVQADLRTWWPAPGAYDLVLVAYLHLPPEELTGVLTRAAAGLDGGGTLLVVGHDRANLEAGVGGPQDPALLYEAGDLAATASAAGLRVWRAEQVERETPEGVALDTLLLAGTAPR